VYKKKRLYFYFQFSALHSYCISFFLIYILPIYLHYAYLFTFFLYTFHFLLPCHLYSKPSNSKPYRHPLPVATTLPSTTNLTAKPSQYPNHLHTIAVVTLLTKFHLPLRSIQTFCPTSTHLSQKTCPGTPSSNNISLHIPFHNKPPAPPNWPSIHLSHSPETTPFPTPAYYQRHISISNLPALPLAWQPENPSASFNKLPSITTLHISIFTSFTHSTAKSTTQHNQPPYCLISSHCLFNPKPNNLTSPYYPAFTASCLSTTIPKHICYTILQHLSPKNCHHSHTPKLIIPTLQTIYCRDKQQTTIIQQLSNSYTIHFLAFTPPLSLQLLFNILHSACYKKHTPVPAPLTSTNLTDLTDLSQLLLSSNNHIHNTACKINITPLVPKSPLHQPLISATHQAVH